MIRHGACATVIARPACNASGCDVSSSERRFSRRHDVCVVRGRATVVHGCLYPAVIFVVIHRVGTIHRSTPDEVLGEIQRTLRGEHSRDYFLYPPIHQEMSWIYRHPTRKTSTGITRFGSVIDFVNVEGLVILLIALQELIFYHGKTKATHRSSYFVHCRLCQICCEITGILQRRTAPRWHAFCAVLLSVSVMTVSVVGQLGRYKWRR